MPPNFPGGGGVTICIPSTETVENCRNKLRFQKILQSAGVKEFIPTLPAKVFIEKNFSEINFPIVVKPIRGRSSRGLHFVNSEREFLKIADEINPDSYIVQPNFFDKEKSKIVTVDVLRNPDFGQVISIPRREHLRTPNGAGLAIETFHDDYLSGVCKKIAELLNIRGCVNMEFIETDKKTYHVLECNVRFSAGINFSHMAGYNFVKNHLCCFAGKKSDELHEYKNIFAVKRYTECLTAISE